MIIGRNVWIFADGDLPPQGTEEPLGHEALMVVNCNNEDAHMNITIFFEDKEPAGGIELICPAKRVKCYRMDYPIGGIPYQIPLGQYALMIESDVPVVANFGRLDRRENMAYYPVQGFSL